MRVFKILQYDCENGIWRTWLRYLPAVIFGILMCIQCSAFIENCLQELKMQDSPSWIHYLMYCLKGAEPYEKVNKEQFVIPVAWMCFMMWGLMSGLGYLYSSRQAAGVQLLIRSKKRVTWWLSKCIWNCLNCLIYFTVLYVTVLVYCMIAGINLSMEVNPNYLRIVFAESSFYLKEQFETGLGIVVITIMILPIVCMCAISMIQLFLELFFKPAICYLVSITILIISVWDMSPFALGNFSMLMRNSWVMQGGLDTTVGIIVCLGVVILISIAGAYRFKHYDILSKEE